MSRSCPGAGNRVGLAYPTRRQAPAASRQDGGARIVYSTAAMTVITSNEALAEACSRFRRLPYVAIDTEFIRERTYWPQPCLVQIAGDGEAIAIDALEPTIDFQPLLELLADTSVLKVFHAARQDIEIFVRLSGHVPAPLFDTQIAAMVCGFGEAASYETLASKLARAPVDKASRFTDWARRPLTDRQIRYALDDVVHLCTVYEKLAARLDETGRQRWLDEEVAALCDPALYRFDPREAWQRIKVRSTTRRLLAVLREVAAWREREAQARDVPRNRVIRDEALLEIAAHRPGTPAELARVRGLNKSFAAGEFGGALLAAVAAGLDAPEAELPQFAKPTRLPAGAAPLIELLKVLLKLRSEQQHVAQRLLANTRDLERIAVSEDADIPAFNGWRREIFGNDALALKAGRVALAVGRRGVRLIDVDGGVAAD